LHPAKLRRPEARLFDLAFAFLRPARANSEPVAFAPGSIRQANDEERNHYVRMEFKSEQAIHVFDLAEGD
jgi:hypothetical protein